MLEGKRKEGDGQDGQGVSQVGMATDLHLLLVALGHEPFVVVCRASATSRTSLASPFCTLAARVGAAAREFQSERCGRLMMTKTAVLEPWLSDTADVERIGGFRAGLSKT